MFLGSAILGLLVLQSTHGQKLNLDQLKIGQISMQPNQMEDDKKNFRWRGKLNVCFACSEIFLSDKNFLKRSSSPRACFLYNKENTSKDINFVQIIFIHQIKCFNIKSWIKYVKRKSFLLFCKVILYFCEKQVFCPVFLTRKHS